MNWAEQRELDAKHVLAPQKGDYWEDHMTGVLQVIDVVHGIVIFFSERKAAGANHWEWDTAQPKSLTLSEFAIHLRYKGESMKDKTWANVHPGREL